MIKEVLKQMAGSFIGMLINAVLAICVTKTINYTHNRYFKKPYCVLCGGTGYRIRQDGIFKVKIKCSCRGDK